MPAGTPGVKPAVKELFGLSGFLRETKGHPDEKPARRRKYD
jgi:hypothetical protein